MMTSPPSSSTRGDVIARLALGSISVALIAQSVWLFTQRTYLSQLSVRSERSVQIAQTASLNFVPHQTDLPERNPVATRSGIKETAGLTLDNRPDEGKLLARALHDSPLRGDLWLMLAASAKASRSTKYDPVALLKLSYYTAPNDLALLPLRLILALGTDSAASEPELRELARRDVKIALANQPALKPAIVAAYRSASDQGRAFADNLISEFDPSYLQSMRSTVRGPVPRTESPSPSGVPGQGPARVVPRRRRSGNRCFGFRRASCAKVAHASI